MIYLTESQVASLVSMPAAIDAVRQAFRELAAGQADAPPRIRCQAGNTTLHLLPAAISPSGGLGFKVYTTTRSNARFQVVIYDAESGAIDAILEADVLGQYRTGAASGVATDALARPDANRLGLYGSGKQARTQLLAVAAVRKLSRVTVSARDPDRLHDFCARMTDEAGVEVVPASSPEDAAQGQDIICTATTSREPVLRGEWVAPGTHVNLVGSNRLAKTEVDAELFARASLVVADSVAQARLEAGDFVAALAAGTLTWDAVSELTELSRGLGRTDPNAITVFQSLGIGLEDVALAQVVVAEARRRRIGTTWESP